MTATRYSQCDQTCTTDCGHCKGEGPPASPVPDLTGGPFCDEQGCRARWGAPLGARHTCGKDEPTVPDYSPAVTATVHEGDPGEDGFPRFYAQVKVGHDWTVTVAQSVVDSGALTVEVDGPTGDGALDIRLPRLSIHLNDAPLFDDREF